MTHASPDCCWRDLGPDAHGRLFRTRPRDECHAADLTNVLADRDALEARVVRLQVIMRERARLAQDVLAEDRGARIDAALADFNAEHAALSDHIELLQIALTTEDDAEVRAILEEGENHDNK